MNKNSILFILAITATFFVINNFLFPPKTYSPPPPESRTEEIIEKNISAAPVYREPEEELYVLENQYQQIVFSSKGGSIAEINLVLKNKDNPQSYVKPIDIDKILENDYPAYDQFPLKNYQTAENSKNPSKTGGYYPLLRRGIDPKFYALTTFADPQKRAPVVFKLTRLEKNLIEWEGNTPEGKIIKTFSFPENIENAPYCIDVSISYQGSLLFISSGIPDVELVSGNFSPSLKYRFTKSGKGAVKTLDLPKKSSSLEELKPSWICNSNGYFGIILNPLNKKLSGIETARISGEEVPSRLCVIDASYDLYPAAKYPGYEMALPLSTGDSLFRMYAGPISSDVLSKIDQTYAKENPDYESSISFEGFFSIISEPFAKFLFFLIKIFYSLTHSWGFSIILLTAALRVLMYPLNGWTIRTTFNMSKKMGVLAPKLKNLQEKYKKDPKKMQMETAALYKQHGVNPLGGCLPSLIQMPFLIGMWDLLRSTFQLRGASFIPGWINNLAEPDILFSWNYPLWFIGTSFHLLPFLLAGIMLIQQKLSSTLPKDKSLWTEQQVQQQFMGNLMTIVFVIFFYNFVENVPQKYKKRMV